MGKPRATVVKPASAWRGSDAADSVVLPHDGRHRRRVTMRTEGDLVFLLDLPEAAHLKHGDGLLLEDGRVIAVVAAEEPVVEITANGPHHLARIAWHIGNRHIPAEILADRIRIAPDHTIEDMVRGLGGTARRTDARFEPEGGAYGQAAAHHGHGDHGHGYHDHTAHRHESHDHPHGHRHEH